LATRPGARLVLAAASATPQGSPSVPAIPPCFLRLTSGVRAG